MHVTNNQFSDLVAAIMTSSSIMAVGLLSSVLLLYFYSLKSSRNILKMGEVYWSCLEKVERTSIRQMSTFYLKNLVLWSTQVGTVRNKQPRIFVPF